MTELPAIPEFETPGALRRALRDSAYPHPTFGAAPGYLQCNLLVLPHGLAQDFSSFCAANPQACPVIYQTAPGQYDAPELGEDIDLRTDLGSYRIFRDGQAISDVLDLGSWWQGDFVTFLLGSSFGLEAMFAAAGIETPWVDRGETPAHYIAGRDAVAGGSFRGPLAVSMRPLPADAAEKARELCAAYPHLHGLPLSVGDPEELGIRSLEAPVAGIGTTTRAAEGEVPLFWASALTAQLALSAARLPFCIANTPGYLLVTDTEVESLRQDPLELTERVDETVADSTAPRQPTIAVRREVGARTDAQQQSTPGTEAEADAPIDFASAEPHEVEAGVPHRPDAAEEVEGDAEPEKTVSDAGAATAPGEPEPGETADAYAEAGDDATSPGDAEVRATGSSGEEDGDKQGPPRGAYPERPLSASRLVRERLAAARGAGADQPPATDAAQWRDRKSGDAPYRPA